MHPRNIDPALLQRRLDQISDGLKEGVRREVQRLRRLGLPIYVGSNGKVLAMSSENRQDLTQR
jgi:chromosome condensin MukBEF MukE localization factor